MNKKKVLITGATGFLGSNVLNKMLERNFKVTAIVRDERKLTDQIIKKNPTNLIVKKTKNFAKRQNTWFKNRFDQNLKIDGEDNLSLVVETFKKII